MLTSPVFSDEIRPIFIVGAPRSGTSITTWAIGQHPNIQPMPETAWIATMAVGGFLSFEYGSSRGRFSHLSNAEFELRPFMRRLGEAVDAIVQDCFEERCHRLYGDYRQTGLLSGTTAAQGEFQIRRRVEDPKRRWIDGTPYNSFFIWALANMFPNAAFIHNLRRPHEVATSLESFDKVGSNPQELEVGLRTWATHTENAWLAERALGSRKVFRLNFERIIGEPERLVRELCAFLGEEYCQDCLLPLGKRINSSEVDHRHEENLSHLKALPAYQSAEALYTEILTRPESEEGDAEAMELLRTRFVEYSRTHTLI